MGYLPYLGAVSVLMAAFYVWKSYVSYLEGEHKTCLVFLTALTDLRERMRCYLDSPRRWAQDYSDPLLDEYGFLHRVREGGDVSAAYREVRDELLLPKTVDALLDGFFLRLGEGYIDAELEAISLTIDKLKSAIEGEALELTRRRRVAGALIGACASGIVILVI